MDKIIPLFTATATATGGRNGHTESSDGVVGADLSVPKEMGGSGKPGTATPEHLFAAGYAACFGGALDLVGAHSPLGNMRQRRGAKEEARQTGGLAGASGPLGGTDVMAGNPSLECFSTLILELSGPFAPWGKGARPPKRAPLQRQQQVGITTARTA